MIPKLINYLATLALAACCALGAIQDKSMDVTFAGK